MGAVQYVLIGLIVLLLVAYPLLMSRKNKAENQKMQEQTNSLKRGDEVLTSAGVYGKVLEVKQDGEAKKVVIETGSDKNKSYLTVDAYSIYTVLNKEPVKDPNAKEEKKEDKKDIKAEDKKDAKVEDKKVAVKDDKKDVKVADAKGVKVEIKDISKKDVKEIKKDDKKPAKVKAKTDKK